MLSKPKQRKGKERKEKEIMKKFIGENTNKMKNQKCKLNHRLGTELWGRDDQTVQLRCLVCGAIVSVDSRDYDEEMQRMAEDDLDFDNHFDDDEDEEPD